MQNKLQEFFSKLTGNKKTPPQNKLLSEMPGAPAGAQVQIISKAGYEQSGLAPSPLYGMGQQQEKETMQAFGVTGTRAFGGYFQEEYLSVLQGRNGVEIFDQMFRSDPQIFSSLLRSINKLKAAKYYIKPPDKSKEAKERAQKLTYCVMKSPTKCWQENLNDLYSFLIHSFGVLEPTFRQEFHKKFGNIWCVNSFGWRSPKTIWQWFITYDELKALRQISWGDDFKYVDIPGKTYIGLTDINGKKRIVPWDEVIILSHLRFGNNLEGIGLLRPMYGPWLRKDNYLKTNAIGIENNARGVRAYGVDSEFLGTDKDKKLDEINQRAVESNLNMVKYAKDKMEFKYEKTDYQHHAVVESLAVEDAYIGKVTNTEAQNMGSGKASGAAGNRSLGEQKGSEHDESIKNYAQYVCEKLNPLIKFLEIANFGEQEDYCELAFEGIDAKGTKEDAEKLQILQAAGFIDNAAPEMKAYVQEHFDYPAIGVEIGTGDVAEVDNEEETEETEDKTAGNGEKQAPGADTGDEVEHEATEHGATIKEIASDAAKGKTKPVKAYAKEIVAAHHKQASEHVDGCQCGQHGTHKRLSATSPVYRRELTAYEGKVNFAEAQKAFDGMEEKFGSIISESFKKYVIPKYTADLKRALRAKEPVHKVELGKRTKVLSLVKDFMIEAVIQGRQQAVGEIEGLSKNKKLAEKKKPLSTPDDLPSSVYGWIKNKSESAVDTLYGNVNDKMKHAAETAMDNEAGIDAAVFDAEEAGEEYIDDLRNTGALILPAMAINEGRWSTFQEALEELQGFQYSAILDDVTCDLCESLDGKTFKAGDPDSTEFTPPIHFGCRCIIVPIGIDEEAPEDGFDGLDSVYDDMTAEEVDKYKKFSEGGIL